MAQDDKIQEEVSNLKSDMSKIGVLVDRLDTTIDKLTELSANVSQLLAVHETKITSQESILKQTVNLVEQRRVEAEAKIQHVHDRVSQNEEKFAAKLDKQHQELLNELRSMQVSSTKQHEEINRAMSARISRLEKWMWGLAGIAGFLVFLAELGSSLTWLHSVTIK